MVACLVQAWRNPHLPYLWPDPDTCRSTYMIAATLGQAGLYASWESAFAACKQKRKVALACMHMQADT